MASRKKLSTVRFTEEEAKQIDRYLKKDLLFDSFSSLARVATLGFIGQDKILCLQAVSQNNDKKPAFLWDYDLTAAQVREILSQPISDPQRLWMISRLLAEAPFQEIFSYITIKNIRETLPKLRLPAKKHKWWEYAVQRWSQHE